MSTIDAIRDAHVAIKAAHQLLMDAREYLEAVDAPEKWQDAAWGAWAELDMLVHRSEDWIRDVEAGVVE